MNIQIIKSEKNDVEVMIDNITLAEVLRVYLYKAGVEFAAWRREHPSQPALFKIKTDEKTVKKVLEQAIEEIKEDCAKLLASVKK